MSKRLRAFKADLIKSLPFHPPNQATKRELEEQPLGSVLFHFVHWALRIVPARPRQYSVLEDVMRDIRWTSHETEIQALLSKVESGIDLSPHLSKLVRTRGYIPSSMLDAEPSSRWADKDFILNTKGFHHFHLGMEIGSTGLAGRTDNVLFAHVSRDSFKVMGIFDHSVFDSTYDGLTKERERLLKIYERFVTQGMPPNSVYIANPITTSGHPILVHQIANQYMHILQEIDPKLDSIEFVTNLYENHFGLKNLKRLNFKWYLNGLDLGLLDEKHNCFILFGNWPI